MRKSGPQDVFVSSLQPVSGFTWRLMPTSISSCGSSTKAWRRSANVFSGRRSSASSQITNSPLVSARPRLRAADAPALVWRTTAHPVAELLRHLVSRTVGRAIVHQDALDAVVGLIEHGLDRLEDERQAVVAGDDDAGWDR